MTSKASPAVDAFSGLAGAYAALSRELNATLVADHGLTLNDYGCLLLLRRSGEDGMRRIDIANELQLSPSGITRLLDRLMDQGLVGRGACKEDARESYAVLTDEGLEKLRKAAPGHVEDIERRFGAVLDAEEMKMLAEFLGRLSESEPDGSACSPD